MPGLFYRERWAVTSPAAVAVRGLSAGSPQGACCLPDGLAVPQVAQLKVDMNSKTLVQRADESRLQALSQLAADDGDRLARRRQVGWRLRLAG